MSCCCTDVTTSAAGPDQAVSTGSTVTLAGNSPTNGCGIWTLVSGGGTIVNKRRPDAYVKNIPAGANVFKWSIRLCGCDCEDSSDDTVTITAS